MKNTPDFLLFQGDPPWFREILDKICLAAVLLDKAGNIVFCNRFLAELVKWPADELMGANWFDSCVPFEQRSRLFALFSHFREQGDFPIHQRYEIMSREGKRCLIDWNSALLHDGKGKIAGILSIGKDVSRQQRMEDSLRESEERFRFVMEGGDLGFWDWNLETGEVHRNEQWAQMLGYGMNEIEFTVRQWNDFVHPDDLAMAWQSINDHLQGKTPLHELEYRMRTKSGHYKWVLDRAKVVKRDNQGRPLRMCGVHTDIDDRRRHDRSEKARNRVLELLARGEPQADILTAIVLGVEAENPDLLCSILLLDDGGKHLRIGASPSLPGFYNAAIDGLAIGPGVGSCGNTAFTGKRTIVEDIKAHPYWRAFRDLAAQAELSSCWSEPIRAVDGRLLGTFAIYRRVGAHPDKREIQIIENAAHLAGIALERKLLDDDLQLASLIYQNSSEGMMIVDADNRILGINPAFTKITGYGEEEVKERNPNILSSGRQSEAFYRDMWEAIETTGHWQGEIWNRRKNGEIYAQRATINTIFNKDGTVHRRVALFSDITKKKQSEELIWKQANFDLITKLPNRRLFRDRFEQEIKKAHRNGLSVALLFIDLDRFKEVNDTLGHDMGDKLLEETARRIGECVRETDTVARLGGDEFTVILPDLADPAPVKRVARLINQKLAQPFFLGNEIAHVSASVGITFYPDDGDELEQLVKNADQAMYAAKNEGRNRFSFFTPSMQEIAQFRRQIANDLRGAMAGGQFQVDFQPIVEMATGRIMKAEALLRWRHPKRGWIAPRDFLPLAEESGLIVEIGDWLLRESIRWAGRWVELAPLGFQICVNKSPEQFNKGNMKSWLGYLQEIRLSAKSIVIEINENLMPGVTSCANGNLAGLRNAGVKMAIDDFGKGYSALSQLNKYPIDFLKLDQAFVENLAMNAGEIVLPEAIIMMAHKLGLKVIAKGVETEEQKNLLASVGCDYAQGYYFSVPLPPEQFEELLKSGLSVKV